MNFQEKKLNKNLVFGLALALVMFSGSEDHAQADCGCLPKIYTPSMLILWAVHKISMRAC